MTEVLLALVLVLLLVTLVLTLLLVLRKSSANTPDRTPELLGQLGTIEKVTDSRLVQLRSDLASQRQDLTGTLAVSQQTMQQTLDQHRAALDRVRETVESRFAAYTDSLGATALATRAEQTKASEMLAASLREGTKALAVTLTGQQTLVQTALTGLQAALNEQLSRLGQGLARTAVEGREEDRKTSDLLGENLRGRLREMAERIDKLSESLKVDAEAARRSLELKMAELQQSNEQRLEQMRQTVDEKLHATLEARLGESFKQVSERLEAVQKGLGEMKALADGVGDLKKVMTNVKTRGTWGEVQLRGVIEDILRPEEFVENFAPRGRGERVEFAVRLPGNEAGQALFLPIDSKFPVEDYQRLTEAQEAADLDGIRRHGKALEDRIKACAKDIHDKYLEPGKTTEFGILFVPFEGLYAEVLRRPGLAEHVQREFKVAVCGPTTLGAVLNSLRMGFRAVAIQRRSGDIGALLSAVKTEFSAFGKVLDSVGNRLRQAQDDIEKVGVRTRAINRKLREVEALPEEEAQRLLPVTLDGTPDDEVAVA